MKKRFIAVLLVSAMVLASFTACSSDSASETTGNTDSQTTKDTDDTKTETKDTSPTKVVLNEVAHSIFYAPMYVAIEEGYFDEEGIELDLVCGFGADKTMTAVLSGEADI